MKVCTSVHISCGFLFTAILSSQLIYVTNVLSIIVFNKKSVFPQSLDC